MRIFNSLLATTIFAMQLMTLIRKNRIAYLTSISLTMFPMGIFLLTSIHASGWALTSVANGWLFLLTATDKQNSKKSNQPLAWVGWSLCLVLRGNTLLFSFKYDCTICN
jgi:hypothetical protein